METLESLYVLISRLSHPEKRYVSWHLGNKDKESRDSALYQILVHQKSYDKHRIKKELAQHQTLSKFTAAAVGSLRQKVLKAMRLYRDGSSLELQMRNMLEEDSILRERLMHDMRAKNLAKLQAMAHKYEAWDILVQVLDRQYEMLLRESPSPSKLEEKLEELETATRHQRLLWQLKTLYHRMFAYRRLDLKDDAPEWTRLLEELDALGAMAPGQQEGFWAKHLTYNIQYHRLYLADEQEKAKQCRKEQRELWEQHPNMVDYKPMQYKVVLANYLVACFVSQDFSPFEETLKTLKELPCNSLDEEGEVFQNVTYLELLQHMNGEHRHKALALVPEIERGLEVYVDKINDARRQTLLMNVAILFFGLGRYAEALDWQIRVMDHKTPYRPDIKVVAALLAMICHYEMGNESFPKLRT